MSNVHVKRARCESFYRRVLSQSFDVAQGLSRGSFLAISGFAVFFEIDLPVLHLASVHKLLGSKPSLGRRTIDKTWVFR